jgi:hypothetical protein
MVSRYADDDLPWIRHPDNGIFNLVAAHPGCNNDKRDFLAGLDHVRKWRVRFDLSEGLHRQLQTIAMTATGRPSEP